MNDLRENLQMLSTVFSSASLFKDSKCKFALATGDDGGENAQANRTSVCESIKKKRMFYSKVSNAVRVLTEWFDGLCEDFESLPHRVSACKLPDMSLTVSRIIFIATKYIYLV